MGLPKLSSDEKTPFEPMTMDITRDKVKWRSYIFGPYYRIAQGAFPSTGATDDEKPVSARNRIAKIIGLVVLILGVLPLLFRTVFLFQQLSGTTLLSLNWALTLIFCMLSLHSIFSLITLFMLGQSGFYNDFIRRSLVAIKHKIPERNPFIFAHVLLGICLFFFIFAFVFFAYENTSDYDHFVTGIANSSATFRHSMFGNQDLYFLDGIVLIWASFVSGLALVIYNLVSNTLVSDYTKFNEELRTASKNNQLAHADMLNNYGMKQLELLDLARFAYSKFSLLVTFTFIAGFVTHGLAGFVMRSFGEELPPAARASTFMFMILGLILLLLDVKRTSDFAHQLTETANILMFERTIYSQMDEKLSQISNNIIFRIEHTHYLPKAFSSFKINEKFFQRAFLIFPFLIEFLHAYRKYVP